MVGVASSILLASAAVAGAALPADRDRVDAALRPRRLVATRVVGQAPTIDGRLDEPTWDAAATATDLVQRRPDPGALATLRTEARVLYDESALFVGVRLLDPSPEKILAPYARRDDYILSDWVFVELDSRHDRRTAFSFGVNPRGVQVDGAFSNDVDFDLAWNAVWESAARISAEGWEAEYRIPLSQLAYAVEGGSGEGSVPAVFGLNVYRYNANRGEAANWSPRLPSRNGMVSHFNELELRVPARRARLEVTPYASVTHAGDTSASGGVDLRAGLGPAFTLATAVHPDFGQVEADPSEVNLTAFETLFTERRPLFTENAGLFAFDMGLPLATRGNSFAAEQAFYSRRIGRPPRLPFAGASTGEGPAGATLLGAARLTGRTSAGWSAGGLLAVSDRETAEFLDAAGRQDSLRVEPLTQYGVARVAKDFRRGASAVGAVATFAGRSRMTPDLAALLPRRAFAAGVDARHRFGRDEYQATGFLLGSQIEGTPEAIARVLHGPGHFSQRPDATHLGAGELASSASGFAGQARLARIGGEHWRWTLAGRVMSPRLELNDVGFQRNADWRVAFASLTYQHERPGPLLRRWAVGSRQVAWGWSFGGERRAAVMNLSAEADLRSYWGGSFSLDHELPALQIEALRGGPALLMPSRDTASVSLYTDTRRPSQARLELRGFREAATGSHQLVVAPTIDLRASDRLSFSLGPSLEWTSNAWQYVGSPLAAGRARHLLARLDQGTVSLTTRLDLAFSPRLSLQLYAQPFASRGDFGEYKEVIEARARDVEDRVRSIGDDMTAAGGRVCFDFSPDETACLPDPAYRVRDLRLNVVLRWEHRPGSALFVVWTQDRHGAPAVDSRLAPVRDLFGVFDAKPSNTFLVKLSYWLARQ